MAIDCGRSTRSWLWISILACALAGASAARAQVPVVGSASELALPDGSATSRGAPALETPLSRQPTPTPSATVLASAEPLARSRSNAPVLINLGLGAVPESVRRETPREALAGFLDATREQDFGRAAHYLNLSKMSAAQQRKNGPQLAQQLSEVLENQVWFDTDAVSDEPSGGLEKSTSTRELQVASIPIKGGTQGIRLARALDARGQQVWAFSVPTVEAIGDLHKRYGPPTFLAGLPAWTKDRPLLGMDPWQWLGLGVLIGLSWAFGLVVQKLAGVAIRQVYKRRRTPIDLEVTRKLEGPTGRVTGLACLLLVVPTLRITASAEQTLVRLVYIAIILSVMRAVILLINHGALLIEAHSVKNISEDLKRRAIATQVTTLRRVAVVLVAIVGVALALMQFPVVRTVGWSLLGSAGIAGAIIGFAAQKTFANVFAGIVISITQPIRIGDTVVVEKEWGQIEEIGTTHVVVKTWDLRRVVLPIVYFLDRPFENWTRTGTELVGIVRIHADYQVDVQAARGELQRILKGDPLWNGKSEGLIVEELNAESVVLRASVSADDASRLWDLRCTVREQMLKFLQQGEHRMPSRRMDWSSRASP